MRIGPEMLKIHQGLPLIMLSSCIEIHGICSHLCISVNPSLVHINIQKGWLEVVYLGALIYKSTYEFLSTNIILVVIELV